jgi:hypothetical protein
MSTSREAFEAWSETFWSGDVGSLTPNECLAAAWQAAMQYAYADAAYLCDQMFNRARDADECADAIRERAKGAGKCLTQSASTWRSVSRRS